MKLDISYVLRYAVLKPMGVVFLGHKVVYESKSILPSISCCFPSIFSSFLKCAHIQKMAWVLQAIWYTIINGRSNVSSQLLKSEPDFSLLTLVWKIYFPNILLFAQKTTMVKFYIEFFSRYSFITKFFEFYNSSFCLKNCRQKSDWYNKI